MNLPLEQSKSLRDRMATMLAENDACGPGPVSQGEYLADADALLGLVREALLSDETIGAVARAQYAAEREIPVDPEMYANTLVRDEYTKFARIGLAAAIVALEGDE